MPAVHVRDLDDAVIDALKRRAAAHRRSLQGELRSILEEAARRGLPAGGGDEPARRPRLRLRTVRIGGKATWSREEIYGDDGR